MATPADAALRTELARALLDYGLADRARLELRHAGLTIDDIEEQSPASSSTAAPLLVEGSSAVQRIPLPTVLGIVMVTLPQDLRQGERISGFLDVSGPGKSQTKKLGRFQVAIGQEVIPVQEGVWSVLLPTSGEQVRVDLQNRRGKSERAKIVNLEPAVGSSAATALTAPATCRFGIPITISGPFDGDSRTTRVSLDGQPIPVLAETERVMMVDCPSPATSQPTLTVEEGGLRLEQASLRAIELDFDVLKLALKKGDVSPAVLRLSGLAGHERPVHVRIHNRNPRIARLKGGDDQILTFTPSDWGAAGAVTRDFTVVGRRSGNTAFYADLVTLQETGPSP